MSRAHQFSGLVWSDPQDLDEHARYWATKSIAERVIAGWELADRVNGCAEGISDGTQINVLKVARVSQSWR